MRTLTVGNLYPPHHFGGYELVWRSAVRHLRTVGIEARVLTTDFRLDTSAEPDDADVHRELRWWWRDHGFPKTGFRERLAIERHNADVFERHLSELRPDVIAWWPMGGMSLSLLERARRAGIPAVAFVHDDWLDYGPKADRWLAQFGGRLRGVAADPVDALLRTPTRVDFSQAARYLFVSESTRRHAAMVGHELADTGVAHSGIAADYLDPQPEAPWSWRLLYVGRVDERKGVATAVRALAHLPGDATLTIAGAASPDAERELRAEMATAGVGEQVRILGPLTHSELRSAYAATNVVVFPVVWQEPWGLVPLEAMGMGRPVVATGRGGSSEYLRDEENALLFDAGDASALAAAVERLARDADLRHRMRERGMATAREHTEDRFNDTVVAELSSAAQALR